MPHERLRPFNTRDVYPHQTLDNDLCMVVKAGNRLFMRGQTGLDLHHGIAQGDAVCAIGNILRSADVPQAMVEAFGQEPEAHLAARLLRALEAGLAADGELKQVQSAALLVVHEQPLPSGGLAR